MNKKFKEFLGTKHVFVNDGCDLLSVNPAYVELALARLFGIRITKGRELLTSCMIVDAEMIFGDKVHVPEPFYRGFPDSVRKLSGLKLLVDQINHYFDAVTNPETFYTGGHSIFEVVEERRAFRENVSVTEFVVVTEEEAKSMLEESVRDLLSSSRPLSEYMFDFVKYYISETGFKPAYCASKNTAIKLLVETRDMQFARLLTLPDVLKVVEYMVRSDTTYHRWKNPMRHLNLKNQDRKFITALINCFAPVNEYDMRLCFEKKKDWCGLLHHIHYKTSASTLREFARAIRTSGLNNSFMSEFEKHMAAGDIKKAVSVLEAKSPAEVMRNLDYILSRSKDFPDYAAVTEAIGKTRNIIVLMQLYIKYAGMSEDERRTFKFYKDGLLKTHTETDDETKRRGTRLDASTKDVFASAIILPKLKELLKGRAGKVYIDPDMKNIAVPIAESAGFGGFGVLPKGSRIKMADGKKIRAFTYWENVNDIDLSVLGITKDDMIEEFSWRSMWDRQSEAITFSGDETRGYHGGSEYFDIIFDRFVEDHPEITHLIFCNNVFSGGTFKDCICTAGYMIRDNLDSGDIYEPKTVKTSFQITAESKQAYLFVIDLGKRDLIWLNIGRDSTQRVAAESSVAFLKSYFNLTDILSVYDLFSMAASQVVEKPEDAYIIVSDKTYNLEGRHNFIRSCDVEKIMALMN